MIEFERKYRAPKAEPVKRRCHRCHGSGRSTCPSCGGQGRIVTSRNPLAGPEYTRCSACFGNKTRRCSTCAGEGLMV